MRLDCMDGTDLGRPKAHGDTPIAFVLLLSQGKSILPSRSDGFVPLGKIFEGYLCRLQRSGPLPAHRGAGQNFLDR
jgi:hypothetical protein